MRVRQTRSAFSTPHSAAETASSIQMKEVIRSPDDEVLLSELAFDLNDLITYEVSSIILVAEREQANPHGTFRCYMDPHTKAFFIEIPDENTANALTRSALLSILGLAEQAGAETVYVCVRNTLKRQDICLRDFLFLGFERLSAKEQAKISMTKTHQFLKYTVKSDEDDEEDF